ncbi:hypothetical protein TrispH2_005840 [Trichoplax sp. H2]|nr:hypothetical protein TrispH2_005840 [Trichoplax sp. H2]|eukprot:RDD41899.1 hypothetical protein TrispH2_005840 [Trichoplax sp. H2]
MDGSSRFISLRMEYLLDKFSSFWNILEASRSRKVAKWDETSLSHAIQWSQYIEEVCNHLRSKPNRPKINQQLFIRYSNNHLQETEPESMVLPSIEYFCNAELMLLKRLLGNENLTLELFQFLLERYLLNNGSQDKVESVVKIISEKCVNNALLEVASKIDAMISENSIHGMKEFSDTSLLKVTIEQNAKVLNQYIEYDTNHSITSREIFLLKKKALFHLTTKNTGIATITTALLQRYECKSESDADPCVQILTEFLIEYYSDGLQPGAVNAMPNESIRQALPDRHRELLMLSPVKLAKLASYCCQFFVVYIRILSKFACDQQPDNNSPSRNEGQQLAINHFQQLLKGPNNVTNPVKQVLTCLHHHGINYNLALDDLHKDVLINPMTSF